jgi:hypothetical protein
MPHHYTRREGELILEDGTRFKGWLAGTLNETTESGEMVAAGEVCAYICAHECTSLLNTRMCMNTVSDLHYIYVKRA